MNCTRHLGIDGSNVQDRPVEIEGHLQIPKLVETSRNMCLALKTVILPKFIPT